MTLLFDNFVYLIGYPLKKDDRPKHEREAAFVAQHEYNFSVWKHLLMNTRGVCT